jgi:hypothetical protein
MKEVQNLLKLVADGLKTLAQGVEAIADKVDEASKAKNKKAPKAPAQKPTAEAKKPPAKAAPKKTARPETAVDTVMTIIGRSTKGVSTAEIKSKTGFNQKKVANIVYKLKKQKKIKSIDKGVYVKI